MAPGAIIEAIWERLSAGRTTKVKKIEDVATILEREVPATVEDWYERVERDSSVITVRLERGERCAHLGALFHDLVSRLRDPLPLGTRTLVSADAAEHGRIRHRQGYTAAMLVEESRMLQVSIFQTLQNNLHLVDFSLLLVDVMAIADEVDSQLAQAMTSFIAETSPDLLEVASG